jgi:cytochrome d ubiquinol oxidase subunit II
MPPEEIVAGIGMLAAIAYAVLGGADFGGGIWDLFASGPRRNAQKQAIAHAMGPVWEANHVWLIFLIVILFSCFPAAYAALSIGLFGLFHLVLVGITLRGAAFVFRGPQAAAQGASQWGFVFGVSSVITPVLLGMAVGAVSSGHLRVVDGQVTTEGPTSWLAPVSIAIGALALALSAYLAAVYLTIETTGELREDFRRRGLYAVVAVTLLALLVLPLLYFEAPHLWEGLTSWRAAPIILAGIGSALLAWRCLVKRRYGIARGAAIAQVALLLLGWGMAQYPYIIYPDMKLSDVAAPRATLMFVLYAVPAGMVVLLPSLWFLFRVFKSEPTAKGI